LDWIYYDATRVFVSCTPSLVTAPPLLVKERNSLPHCTTPLLLSPLLLPLLYHHSYKRIGREPAKEEKKRERIVKKKKKIILKSLV